MEREGGGMGEERATADFTLLFTSFEMTNVPLFCGKVMVCFCHIFILWPMNVTNHKFLVTGCEIIQIHCTDP